MNKNESIFIGKNYYLKHLSELINKDKSALVSLVHKVKLKLCLLFDGLEQVA